jgi:hypothetical protein
MEVEDYTQGYELRVRVMAEDDDYRDESLDEAFVRFFFAAAVGSVPGAVLGVLNPIIYQLESDPGAPLRHEWYIFAYLGGLFWGAIAGALVGLLYASLRRSGDRAAAVGGVLVGALVGMLLAWHFPPEPPSPASSAAKGIQFMLAGAFLGLYVGAISYRLLGMRKVRQP